MEKSALADYIGVPVIVQLKNFPLVAVQVQFRDKLPHAADPSKLQWLPNPVMLRQADGQEAPVATQLLQFAVLRAFADSDDIIEIRCFSRPPDPRNPHDPFKKAVLATLIQMDDILSVTRIVSVEEPSSILIAPG